MTGDDDHDDTYHEVLLDLCPIDAELPNLMHDPPLEWEAVLGSTGKRILRLSEPALCKMAERVAPCERGR
ncbi:hypothetical protein OG555_08400 [Kribbella sp. NBC_01484]|uniref:hypothetical protein n=1 Tax=Kribbella sp. NBC_01484 TaxID=2903579 RepID=UPI002E36D910|nr:hypothetical protein [Kribbella sp. NBC_01484]